MNATPSRQNRPDPERVRLENAIHWRKNYLAKLQAAREALSQAVYAAPSVSLESVQAQRALNKVNESTVTAQAAVTEGNRLLRDQTP